MFQTIKQKIKRHPILSTALLSPFLLLIFFSSINPLLQEVPLEPVATYCPLPASPIPPTVLEQDFGIFASPVTHAIAYATWILVFYFIGFAAYRIRKAAKEHSKTDETFERVVGPSVIRIISPFF